MPLECAGRQLVGRLQPYRSWACARVGLGK